MRCPHCKKETTGSVSPDYLLKQFCPEDEEELPTGAETTWIIFICEHCKKKWKAVFSIKAEKIK